MLFTEDSLKDISEQHYPVQFSSSAVSDCLWPHEPQHIRPPCPSPTSGIYPNSRPVSRSLSSPSPATFNLSQHQIFSNESALWIRWPKYWSFSFSISPSSEYSGLISFRIQWFDLAVQGTLKSSPIPQFKSISSSALSFLYSPTPVSLPRKSNKQRNLVGYNPRSHKELDTTDRLTYTHTHTSIHDHWKNHSFDWMDLCQQSNVSVFLIFCLGLS